MNELSLAFEILSAQKIVIVPGYGMAVTDAHIPLGKVLMHILPEHFNKKIRVAIHPAAGKIPGHMNALLSEAEIPYFLAEDFDKIDFEEYDLAICIGANLITNLNC